MKLKFNELVSKVTIEGRAKDDLVKQILSWVKPSQPIVIVKNGDKS